MRNYTKIKTIRITKEQHQTLQKMKELNIDVGRFIRCAISEKIEKDKYNIIKPKEVHCPF